MCRMAAMKKRRKEPWLHLPIGMLLGLGLGWLADSLPWLPIVVGALLALWGAWWLLGKALEALIEVLRCR